MAWVVRLLSATCCWKYNIKLSQSYKLNDNFVFLNSISLQFSACLWEKIAEDLSCPVYAANQQTSFYGIFRKFLIRFYSTGFFS